MESANPSFAQSFNQNNRSTATSCIEPHQKANLAPRGGTARPAPGRPAHLRLVVHANDQQIKIGASIRNGLGISQFIELLKG
jgi:hypothetical protein